jgi:hypothetical protein
MIEKGDVISRICRALTAGAADEAASIAKRDYPFAPEVITKRTYGSLEATCVFVRDGFIDRYTGERLIFPPVLRILSALLPSEFPYHPNWKTDLTHPSYWELGATIDHVIPVTRGGPDNEANWVTTSMARNSAKMNWTIQELGWSLLPPGDVSKWDGQLSWFLEYTAAHREAITPAIKGWYRAALAARAQSDYRPRLEVL